MTIYSIDSHKVEQNIQMLQRKAGVPLIAVVKNNGYGLGLEWLAKTTRDAGITQFAITELADIAPLRETIGNDADILMLRSTALYEELKVSWKTTALQPLDQVRQHAPWISQPTGSGSRHERISRSIQD